MFILLTCTVFACVELVMLGLLEALRNRPTEDGRKCDASARLNFESQTATETPRSPFSIPASRTPGELLDLLGLTPGDRKLHQHVETWDRLM